MSEYIAKLSEAIAAMHECRCTHFGTAHIKETHKGETVWEGDVEIFQLEGHPEAKVAYGWGWENDSNEIQYIGILQVPPVEDAVTAVRAALVSGKF